MDQDQPIEVGKNLSYVGEKAKVLAEGWEQRLCYLPSAAGILFAGVLAKPWQGGDSNHFEVFIGIARNREKDTIVSLFHQTFAEEINSGKYTFELFVYQGSLSNGRTGPKQAL